MTEEPRYVLTIYLRGGQVVELPCDSWEFLTEPATAPDGTVVSPGLHYSPHDWTTQLGTINVEGVDLIMQKVRADVADETRARYEKQIRDAQDALSGPRDADKVIGMNGHARSRLGLTSGPEEG